MTVYKERGNKDGFLTTKHYFRHHLSKYWCLAVNVVHWFWVLAVFNQQLRKGNTFTTGSFYLYLLYVDNFFYHLMSSEIFWTISFTISPFRDNVERRPKNTSFGNRLKKCNQGTSGNSCEKSENPESPTTVSNGDLNGNVPSEIIGIVSFFSV